MSKSKIYSLLLFVMLLWGMNVIATKILVTSFMPVTMTAFRIFTAGCIVFLILGFLKAVRLPKGKEWFYIFIGSLFNVVGHHYFLSVGLTKTSATNTGLILGMAPLLTAILAMLFLKDKATVLKVVGVLLGFFGVSFVILGNGESLHHISSGDIDIFLSILSQSVSFITIKKASKTIDPRLMTGYMLIFGSALLFVISLIIEPSGLSSMTRGSIAAWSLFLLSALLATAFGHMIYNYSVGKIGAAEASIFINFNPFFALIGSLLFLGETIVWKQLLGFIFIILGVTLGSGAYEELMRRFARKRHVYMK